MSEEEKYLDYYGSYATNKKANDLSEEEIINKIYKLRNVLTILNDYGKEDVEAIDGLLDLYKKIKRDYINPQKARISYFDTKRNSQVVIEGFISKNKLREIMYPTPTNPIPLEVQMSNMYRKIIKLLEE